MVWGWGWLSWIVGVGPQCCEAIAELTIKQLCCSDRGILILSSLGKLFYMYYTSETQCPQIIEGNLNSANNIFKVIFVFKYIRKHN